MGGGAVTNFLQVFWSREAVKVSIPRFWHNGSSKTAFLSDFEGVASGCRERISIDFSLFA